MAYRKDPEVDAIMAEIRERHPAYVELSGKRLDDLLVLKQKPIDAVPTPFPAWSSRCGDFGGGVGLARGWHITLAGNTGHGKSRLALAAARTGIEHGEQVGVVSLEMSWEQLTTRLMAIASGEKVRALEPGKYLDPVVHKRAARVMDRIKETTGGAVWCNARDINELQDVEDAIRYLHEEKGCRYIIVDYLQLVTVTGITDRIESVTMISHAVRHMAKSLKIITLGLSQFNRETSKNYEDPPTVQGLMGGSPLENDSDQVVMIDHSSYKKSLTSNTAQQTILLAKNRHGATHAIECEWDNDNLRIAQIHGAPVPDYRDEDRGEAWEPEEPREPRLLA